MEKSKIAFLSGAVLLFACGLCQAATTNAVSGSFADVRNAVAAAAPGDTVVMPPGTNVWTGTITLNNISLVGAGTNRTVIIDEADRSSGGLPLIVLSVATNLYSELSGFTIQGGVNNTAYNYKGDVVVGGSSPNWRVHHLVFNRPYAKAIVLYGAAYGVIDHCTFIMIAQGVVAYGDGYGDTSWATPVNYGSAGALYVEDCVFTNTVVNGASAATDFYAGARVVFRRNLVQNDGFFNHGLETSGRLRGARSFEVYENTFVNVNNTHFQYYTPINLRSGTGVIFSNTMAGYQYPVVFNDYRVTDPFDPWGGASGVNPWDSNSAAVFTGAYSGPDGATTLSVSNAGWSANQWAGFTVLNTRSGLWGVVATNSDSTLYFMSPRSANFQIYFTNGDNYAVHQVYPVLDQVGVGSGDLITGDGPPWGGPIVNFSTGTAAWPHQAPEPLYCWGNVLNGSVTPISCGYPNIRENRDFYNSPKPGYTPLPYPHPLNTATIATPTTTPVPVPLAPPSGLSAHPPGP